MRLSDLQQRRATPDNEHLDDDLRRRMEDLTKLFGSSQRGQFERLVHGPYEETIQSRHYQEMHSKALALLERIDRHLTDDLDDLFVELEKLFKQYKGAK